MEIALNKRIPATLRSEIKQYYLASIDECSDEEIEYVNKKFRRTIERLERSSNPLEQELARFSYTLHELLLDELQTGFEEHHRYIIAALFYLCNPFDVIPDFNVQDGYLDDAIVINLCMSELKIRSKNSYLQLIEILSKEAIID